MEVVMLGTGSIMCARQSSSFLVDGSLLVDCPNGCTKGMRRLGLDPGSVDACLITHFHADHYFDLPFLLLEAARGGSHDLVICGPRGIRQRVRSLFRLAYPEDWEKTCKKANLRWLEVRDGRAFSLLGYKVTPHSVSHQGYDAYGYSVTRGGKTVAFTGDSARCEGAERLARLANLAFVDCSFPKGGDDHMGCEDYLELTKAYGRSTRIIPTHMSDAALELLGSLGVETPSDGEVFHA